MEYIQLISIALEVIITVLFIRAALRGHTFAYGLAVAFGIYVYYDLVRLFEWNQSEYVVTGIFLVATVAALISAWMLQKKR